MEIHVGHPVQILQILVFLADIKSNQAGIYCHFPKYLVQSFVFFRTLVQHITLHKLHITYSANTHQCETNARQKKITINTQ